MSEIPTPIPVGSDAHGAPVDGPLAGLERSVRRLRVWMAVLSAVVALMVLGSCAAVALFFGGILAAPIEEPPLSPEAVADARTTFEKEFGDSLEDLDVRAVSIVYDEAPFPFSLIEGAGNEQAVYVEYKLDGTDVVVAGLVGMWGEGLSSSGLLPMQGPLGSRMTEEQFRRLLGAYSEQTSKPLGGVQRYGETFEWREGTPAGPSVTIDDKEYPTKELWAATEGQLIEGETFKPGGMILDEETLVFHEDPKTGELTFLGREPAEPMW